MELLNDLFLLPYTIFNYLFSAGVWVFITVMIFSWWRDSVSGYGLVHFVISSKMDDIRDWFKEKFGK